MVSFFKAWVEHFLYFQKWLIYLHRSKLSETRLYIEQDVHLKILLQRFRWIKQFGKFYQNLSWTLMVFQMDPSSWFIWIAPNLVKLDCTLNKMCMWRFCCSDSHESSSLASLSKPEWNTFAISNGPNWLIYLNRSKFSETKLYIEQDVYVKILQQRLRWIKQLGQFYWNLSWTLFVFLTDQTGWFMWIAPNLVKLDCTLNKMCMHRFYSCDSGESSSLVNFFKPWVKYFWYFSGWFMWIAPNLVKLDCTFIYLFKNWTRCVWEDFVAAIQVNQAVWSVLSKPELNTFGISDGPNWLIHLNHSKFSETGLYIEQDVHVKILQQWFRWIKQLGQFYWNLSWTLFIFLTDQTGWFMWIAPNLVKLDCTLNKMCMYRFYSCDSDESSSLVSFSLNLS